MNHAKQCAIVRTEGYAQSHNTPDTHTTQRTVGHPSSLKDLAGAVLGRTTPRTKDAHSAQTSCTSAVENRRADNVDHQAIDEDLERLIQESARFWLWDAEDLRLIRETAAHDPDGIRLALITDPLRHFYGAGTEDDTPLGSKAEAPQPYPQIHPERPLKLPGVKAA